MNQRPAYGKLWGYMTREFQDLGEMPKEAIRPAGVFEKVGIWAGNRLLQYLDTLGEVSEQPIKTVYKAPRPRRKQRPFRWNRIMRNYASMISVGIVAGGVSCLAVILSNHSDHSARFIPPTVEVGPEQTNPYFLIQTLDKKGSYATFPYGVLVNNTDGLIFQVDPRRLGLLAELTNLVPPKGSMVVGIIGENNDFGPELLVNMGARYETEQGKISYVSTSAPLPFSQVKKSLGQEAVDPASPSRNLEFTFKWMRMMKEQVGFLSSGQKANPNLSSAEIMMAGELMPFKVVAVP